MEGFVVVVEVDGVFEGVERDAERGGEGGEGGEMARFILFGEALWQGGEQRKDLLTVRWRCPALGRRALAERHHRLAGDVQVALRKSVREHLLRHQDVTGLP